MRKRIDYPMGSISSGTMRSEDLIPTFCTELDYLAMRKDSGASTKIRKQHRALVLDIEARNEAEDYYDSEDADTDLNNLFDALNEYAAPYFYFGSHPGDGADYGFWLSESWDEDFYVQTTPSGTFSRDVQGGSIKANDLADIPSWFRGEVAVVNDHGNVSLYVKTSRTLREIWSVV